MHDSVDRRLLAHFERSRRLNSRPRSAAPRPLALVPRRLEGEARRRVRALELRD